MAADRARIWLTKAARNCIERKGTCLARRRRPALAGTSASTPTNWLCCSGIARSSWPTLPGALDAGNLLAEFLNDYERSLAASTIVPRLNDDVPRALLSGVDVAALEGDPFARS